MEWIFLFVAGLLEIGWPLGFKLSQSSQDGSTKWLWIIAAVISMAGSGYFLWLAQRNIPIGTAYAIWTGVGAAGTFIIGILFFKDAATAGRILSFFLIVAGIIGLKLTS
ncbi:MAG: multidrug efflux SMR transporter [Ignavibacteria bacterium]|nr:multidrug efflux SMR transporter [Ignavibacteria bacterium]